MLDVEVGFISKLLQTKDIMTVKDSQIKLTHFTGDNKVAYQYIYDTFMKPGEVPTVRAFKRKFPHYPLEMYRGEVGTEENLLYWCQELRVKTKHNELADLVDVVASKLQDFHTEEAYSEIKKKIAFIENEVVDTSDVDITKGTEDRIKAYQERKKNKGMIGIPTGIRYLDYLTKGLIDETLTTVIANTGVGKTWLQILIGSNCMLQNYRVLQFVTEMSEEIMRDRYEAVLFSKCYTGMNYNAFKSGNLPLDVERQYFQFLSEDLPAFEPLIIATASGVMGVSAEIDKYDPDIILIDSAYLMEDDQGAKDDWLRVAHITRDLKKLAKRCKKPIVINTQADKNTSKKTGPELGSIMYTQAIGQDSDNVIALFRDEIMLNDREMGLKVLKQREGTLGKLTINWDFDTMNFSDIFMESNEESPVEESEGDAPKNTLDINELGGD